MAKLKSLLKNLPLHPLFFAVFPLLKFYTHNQRELLLNVLWIPLLLSLILAFSLWFFYQLIFKNIYRSSWLTSLTLLIFFSYGHIQNISGEKHLSDNFLLLLSLVILVLLAYLTRQISNKMHFQTKILNLVALSLVLGTSGQLISHQLTRKETPSHDFEEKITPAQTEKTSPDIYYLILDRYASAKNLKEFYSFDNKQFINFLTNKGFYVASDSLANYPKTYLSLTSSLNMEHLTYLTEILGENNHDLNPLFQTMQDFKVWHLLKEQGYQFVYLGNWWDQTQTNPHADLNLVYQFNRLNLSEFSTKFLTTTMFYPLAKDLFFGSPLENPLNINYVQAKTSLYTFEKLSELPKLPGPKFVFAHLLVPHLPYVFGQNGEISLETKDLYTPKDYINQLIFVNKKIQESIEAILSLSNPAPVLILQSDEGPFSRVYGNQGEGIDWTKLSDNDLCLHLGILNAYYFPDEETKKILYSSITPVNSFRIVFNSLFGTNFELLEDTVYITPDTKHPYQFIDVTNRVRS